jgi:hypothetical protein
MSFKGLPESLFLALRREIEHGSDSHQELLPVYGAMLDRFALRVDVPSKIAEHLAPQLRRAVRLLPLAEINSLAVTRGRRLTAQYCPQ